MTGLELDISQAQKNYDASVAQLGYEHPDTIALAIRLANLEQKRK